MEKERVIFRREYDPYQKAWGYLAIFPDDETNTGMVAVTPFKITEDHNGIFEPYCEASVRYVLSKKIIHKGTDEAKRCLAAIEQFYDAEFNVVEKMTRR